MKKFWSCVFGGLIDLEIWMEMNLWNVILNSLSKEENGQLLISLCSALNEAYWSWDTYEDYDFVGENGGSVLGYMLCCENSFR